MGPYFSVLWHQRLPRILGAIHVIHSGAQYDSQQVSGVKPLAMLVHVLHSSTRASNRDFSLDVSGVHLAASDRQQLSFFMIARPSLLLGSSGSSRLGDKYDRSFLKGGLS